MFDSCGHEHGLGIYSSYRLTKEGDIPCCLQADGDVSLRST